MSFIQFVFFTIAEHPKAFIGIILLLVGAWIPIRYNEIKIKREKFEKGYSMFKESLAHATYQTKTGDTTLNLVILGEYPEHHTAMTDFIANLKGSRRRRFKKKWNEYAEQYDKLKSIGHPAIAACTAILPTEDCPTDPASLDRYERERRAAILNIYEELVNIGKKEIWY